jgi:O-antigen/teichoic acid export membrane protein
MTFRAVLRSASDPTGYLGLVNIVSAGLAFVRGIIVARALVPAELGVVGIIAAINATVLNLLDVRLVDLASKLYYKKVGASEADQRGYRAGVLVLCILGNALVSLGLAAAGVFVGKLAIGLFTASPISDWWLVAQSGTLALDSLSSTVNYLQRLTGRFHLFGSIRLGTQIAALLLFVTLLLPEGGVSAYFLASFIRALFAFGITMLGTWFAWSKLDNLQLRASAIRSAFADYRIHTRYLFYGNLLGYTKLVHRTADTLIVGLFADDRTTGLYKFARSLTDGLYGIFDAISQVYQPRFLELLAEGRRELYRLFSARLVRFAAVFTVALLALEALLLQPLLLAVFGQRYLGSEVGIAILTVPFFFVTGIYTWLWPVFVYTGDLRSYTVASVAAATAQVVVMVGLLLSGGQSVADGAFGYLAHYLILMPVGIALAGVRFSEYLPPIASVARWAHRPGRGT